MENKNHREHNNEGRAELILNSKAFINFEEKNFGELTFFSLLKCFLLHARTKLENNAAASAVAAACRFIFLYLSETFESLLLLVHFTLSFAKFRGFCLILHVFSRFIESCEERSSCTCYRYI